MTSLAILSRVASSMDLKEILVVSLPALARVSCMSSNMAVATAACNIDLKWTCVSKLKYNKSSHHRKQTRKRTITINTRQISDKHNVVL